MELRKKKTTNKKVRSYLERERLKGGKERSREQGKGDKQRMRVLGCYKLNLVN